MKIKLFLAAITSLLVLCSSLSAGQIMISDAYARSSGPLAKAGAAYMRIMNHSDESDRLIGVQSDIAKKTELHTHSKDDNGVMKMVRIDEGIKIGAMKEHSLIRGGQHVMFMGLTQSLQHGDKITVTLIFERFGSVKLAIPVDLERTNTMKHDD